MPTAVVRRRPLPSTWVVLSMLVFALGFALMAPAASAKEPENPACEAAIKAFDAQYDDQSDEAAMTAAEALVETCAKPDALRGRAVSRVAYIHYLRKDLRAALRSFEESTRLAPENVTLRQSLCGMYIEAARYQEAINTCVVGMTLAKQQDDGTPEKHDRVLRMGYNLALAKMRRGGNLCSDHSILEMLEAFRAAHTDEAWVHHALGAWAWDCDDDFERGFALYKRSCALGHEPACAQVRHTEACMCQEHVDEG